MRSQPRLMMSSIARKGSMVRSKARWNVTDIPFAHSISCRFLSISTVPSSVRHPKTTPSAPNSLHIVMSSFIRSISRGEYRKSPPRGRMMTFSCVDESSFRATFISPYDGVVPPSGIPAQSSTRSAPPSCAARQLSTPFAQTSNLNPFMRLLVVICLFPILRRQLQEWRLCRLQVRFAGILPCPCIGSGCICCMSPWLVSAVSLRLLPIRRRI